MNTTKMYLLFMCLCAVIGAQAMIRKTGSCSPITPSSRCQSPVMPLSPSTCRSPQSTKTDSAEVVAYMAMIEAKRVQIERSIDEKIYQDRMARRSAWYDADGEGAGVVHAYTQKMIQEIKDLRQQLPR